MPAPAAPTTSSRCCARRSSACSPTTPSTSTLVFELFTLSRRNEEIAAEFAQLLSRARDHVAALLDAKQREGVVHLHASAEAVADVLFALGDGLAIRMLADPDRDWAPTVDAAELAVRALLA